MQKDREYILCAAILRIVPKKIKCRYRSCNDIYRCELGWRHADILYRFEGEVSKNPFDGGFFTSRGRYVSREEAATIARNAGQINKCDEILYSEDLY